MDIGAINKGKGKATKERATRAKASRTRATTTAREKAMETTTKEGSARAKERYRCNRKDGNNSRLDKAIHSARAMHKHHTKATKERQR